VAIDGACEDRLVLPFVSLDTSSIKEALKSRARLLAIADKCPVHRTLTSEVDIRTALADPLSGSAAPPG
jgi:hypothetical protein